MFLPKARSGLAALGLALLATGAALAQTQPKKPAQAPAPAPVQAQPQPQQAAPPAGQPAPGGQPAGPVRLDLQPSQNDWTKVCGPANGKEICYTTRDFGQAPDQPPVLALAVYDVKGDDNKIVRLLLPPGLLLRPGFRFNVDKNAALDGTFEICFPNGCFAESRVKGATVDQIKKGTTMAIVVRNQFNNEVTFALPLAGFGKSFDGPAIDPAVLEQKQKELQDQMQKQVEEERRKLEAQQGGAAAPAPAPAPAK